MNINKVKIQEAFNSFLDEKIAKLKPLHKALVCLCAILLPCIAFYFLSYSPKSDEIDNLQVRQKKLEEEIAKIDAASRSITKHRAEMAETKLMFAKASALLPQQQEIPSLLISISDVGQNSGLDFLTFIPKSEIKKDFYADIPVEIKVRGTYHNVGSFLDKISNLSRIVTVANLDMSNPRLQAGEMMLETRMSLVTYRSVEPAPQAEDKKKK